MVPATFVMTPAASKLHDEQALARPGYDTPLDLTIFVSCYNESDYITRTLDTVRAALAQVGRLTYEIIVIDDVSKDGSPGIVEDYIRSHPDERIILQRNAFNRGLAQNYFDAAFIGKGRYYRLICGDDAEPLDTMIAVFGATGDADMVVPYYVSSEGRSRQRMLLSNAFTLLVNTISNHNLHYYNGLAVHLRHNVMRWHPNTRELGLSAPVSWTFYTDASALASWRGGRCFRAIYARLRATRAPMLVCIAVVNPCALRRGSDHVPLVEGIVTA
jgi:glycosyltransferase involved in cell wall biosynthesis